jgi:hypothetical protein
VSAPEARRPLDDERIIAIAKAKGHFRVSHRYREDRVRRRCDRLVRAGKLYRMPYWMVTKKLHDDPRSATFYAIPEMEASNG